GGTAPYETPGRFDASGDADARAGGDIVALARRQQVERGGIERQSIVGNGDAQRLAELAGAGAELAVGETAAALLHLEQAILGFEGADQHGAARLADDIQAPVNAIDPVDIGVSGRAEHGRVARGGAIEAM